MRPDNATRTKPRPRASVKHRSAIRKRMAGLPDQGQPGLTVSGTTTGIQSQGIISTLPVTHCLVAGRHASIRTAKKRPYQTAVSVRPARNAAADPRRNANALA
jgi:hypothetical protein